jgi:nucleoside phosphorylase
MIDILLVDDVEAKCDSITTFINQILDTQPHRITVARNVTEAVDELRQRQFDLMILDLNLPKRSGDPPTPDGGLHILDALKAKTKGTLTPIHLVGLTALPELVDKHAARFTKELWHLVAFSSGHTDWFAPLGSKLVHIAESKIQAPTKPYGVDLAIVTALHHVELEAVLALETTWIQEPGDETIYHRTNFASPRGTLRVIACAANEMGLAASAATAMNVIHRFRPRYLAMTGIAAGARGNFGDVLVATHVWDYASGKVRHKAGLSEFLPAPSQIQLEPVLKSKLNLFCLDQSVTRRIRAEWQGDPQPATELAHHLGPMASGGSVVESKPLMDQVKKQHAKLIGLEMEAYGIFMAAKVCDEPRPQAFVIKSVCDFGKPPKTDEYQRYAGYTSAQFLKAFAVAHL